ncbi:glycoside hydrolase family 27 protein [Elizabethkingia meningoseptica]|uniref:glycoside hydrolase family 27 protein n=1 Tax=Elizabethkingia meningoseptica TaxID=238 RepID=UPI0023AF5F6E|nr:glycoside hydrolase family 27 protein [Elizabethkingia meningoseptica]MDE5491535.1 glycoside hydrolase family 27 protein [Elizabethkingia meningoseptica]
MKTGIRKTIGALALSIGFSLFAQKPKPPVMGWSSWNNFRIHINEQLIREQADALVSSGLYAAGYRYINIDDGYFGGRDEKGNLITDSGKFPSGMKNLADYIHSKGLKAGIYSDAGKNTCGSIWDADKQGIGVGLYNHIEQDTDLFFKKWKYDFIKVDWCGGEQMKLNEQEEYSKIIQSVKSINPNIVFNICRWQFPGKWAINIADSWRVSGDIRAEFSSILHIIDLNKNLYPYASAGHYNDMDMLQVGRGMSYDEDKTHFSMWSMLNSPLLAGNDLRTMNKSTIEILTNKEIIALNQDIAFKQAQNILSEGNIEVWKKELSGNQKAIAIMNRGDQEVNYTLAASKLGFGQNTKVRNLWLHQNLGKYGSQKTFTLPKHGIIVLKTY